MNEPRPPSSEAPPAGQGGGRFAPLAELTAMIWYRRAWLLAPLLLAIALVLVFVTVAEMPVLIPFFYAVF